MYIDSIEQVLSIDKQAIRITALLIRWKTVALDSARVFAKNTPIYMVYIIQIILDFCSLLFYCSCISNPVNILMYAAFVNFLRVDKLIYMITEPALVLQADSVVFYKRKTNCETDQ